MMKELMKNIGWWLLRGAGLTGGVDIGPRGDYVDHAESQVVFTPAGGIVHWSDPNN